MEQIERIDQYLDRALTAEESVNLEQALRIDNELSDLFDRVVIAREVVRSSALRSQVRELHFKLLEEIGEQEDTNDVDISPVVIKPLWYSQPLKWSTRIAASGLLLMLGYGGYQFTSLNTNSLYSDKLIPYELPNVRGAEDSKTAIDVLYKTGKFSGVIKQFAVTPAPTPRDQFLTGMAYLQLKQYSQAIEQFTRLRERNERVEKPLFTQETDYYLALAYLGDKQIDNAHALFDKIKNTPRHLYQQNVTKQDLWKLSLLRWKE